MSWKCEACGSSVSDNTDVLEQWDNIHEKIFREIFRCASRSMHDEARMIFRMSLIVAIVYIYKENMKKGDMPLMSDDVLIQKCMNRYRKFIINEFADRIVDRR